ncbi:MAG: hypothetical protein ACI9T9_001214 [Oleiphilaceae bacterium]|jgi:hypothetical protein
MSINWNRNQPIILHLRSVLPRVFPVLTEPGHGLHSSGIGGYIARTTRSGNFSAHSEGRAADIFLNANDHYEAAVGCGLVKMFRLYATELGVHNVIWDRRIWSVSRGERQYTGSSHRNHIHVEFTRDGSQLRPVMLSVRLNIVLSGLSMEVIQYRRSVVAAGL